MSSSWTHRAFALCCFCALGLSLTSLSGCTGDKPSAALKTGSPHPSQYPTARAFYDALPRIKGRDDRRAFEGDMLITFAQAKAFFARAHKSHEHSSPTFGTKRSALTRAKDEVMAPWPVRTVFTAGSRHKQTAIRWCVVKTVHNIDKWMHNGQSQYSKWLQAAKRAFRKWENATRPQPWMPASLKFVHKPNYTELHSSDPYGPDSRTCSSLQPDVDLVILVGWCSTQASAACADFPQKNSHGSVHSTIYIPPTTLHDTPDGARYLMLHEVGHVLGFRHESHHPDYQGSCNAQPCQSSSDCQENPYRKTCSQGVCTMASQEQGIGLTGVDLLSIMGYSSCGFLNGTNSHLSPLDKQGAKVAFPLDLEAGPAWPLAGDVDGDQRSDKVLWFEGAGKWEIHPSSGGKITFSQGTYGDIPMMADDDKDGKDELIIFRPSIGTWFVYKPDGTGRSFVFGIQGDIPRVGDIDGDKKADYLLFRPSTGTWFGILSSIHTTPGTAGSFQFGMAGDYPMVADVDGDGKDDYLVFRPSTGTWYALYSNQTGSKTATFGASGDIPVAADLDGDHKADFALYRPSTGTWFIQYANGTNGTPMQNGQPGDLPLITKYWSTSSLQLTLFRPNTNSSQDQQSTETLLFGGKWITY